MARGSVGGELGKAFLDKLGMQDHIAGFVGLHETCLGKQRASSPQPRATSTPSLSPAPGKLLAGCLPQGHHHG